VVRDLNEDGSEDLILAGNIYETEVETPRLDAISGTVLLSEGDGTYQVLPHLQSGMYLRGNIKSLISFNAGGSLWVLAGVNDGIPLLYRLNANKSIKALAALK
jgi:hypothetical protein